MLSPKLRRVFALTALLSALSLLPAQAAGLASREPQRVSFSERLERWETSAWSLLAGFLQKAGASLNPDGQSQKAGASLNPDGQSQKAGASLNPDGTD